VAGGLLPAGSFSPDGVPLHAERRGLEGVGAAAIVKRIEHDLDLIVVVNIFAIRHAGANFAGIIEADEDGVEIFLVVTEIRLCRLGDGLAVVGLALGKSGNFGHLQGDFALRLHGKEVVNGWRALQAGDGEGWRTELRRGSNCVLRWGLGLRPSICGLRVRCRRRKERQQNAQR
jgi:hypothetical protein